jgi:hypothetical protein
MRTMLLNTINEYAGRAFFPLSQLTTALFERILEFERFRAASDGQISRVDMPVEHGAIT